MVEAIKYHTTAKANMGILTKILYVADWISADRNFDNIEYIRKLAKKNIDEAIIYLLEKTIKETKEQNKLVHRR